MCENKQHPGVTQKMWPPPSMLGGILRENIKSYASRCMLNYLQKLKLSNTMLCIKPFQCCSNYFEYRKNVSLNKETCPAVTPEVQDSVYRVFNLQIFLLITKYMQKRCAVTDS